MSCMHTANFGQQTANFGQTVPLDKNSVRGYSWVYKVCPLLTFF